MKYFFLLLSLTTLSTFSFADDELQIGLATQEITPSVEEKIPLGGYGSFDRRKVPFQISKDYPFLRLFKPAQGALDPIRAKVMYLKGPDKKLLFISLDVIGVTKEMRTDLIKRLQKLGFDTHNVIISGTHTHAGPGALSPNLFWEIFAMDRFQKKYYERFMKQVIDTVTHAMSVTTPGELFTLSFNTSNLTRNRRGSDRPLNPMANLLLAKAHTGEWLGGIVNFAVHGTSLGSKNLFFSSDTPGAIERELEMLLINENGLFRPYGKASFLFVNGAEGDVSPGLGTHEEMGKEFARQTKTNWSLMKPLTAEWKTLNKEITLYKPKVNLRKCIDKKWMPKKINIGLNAFISKKTTINQIRFGKLWLLTWPGEATTEIGLKLNDEAMKHGAQESWFFGLTNDHLAYFTTPEEFKVGGYETCVNFFGENGGLRLIDEHKKLFQLQEGHL